MQLILSSSFLTFLSNRINERVSIPGNQQTSTDQLIHLAWNIFLKTHRLTVLNSMRVSKLSKRFGPILGGRFQVPFVSIAEDKLFESQFRAKKVFRTFQRQPLWSQINHNSFWLFGLFWSSVNPLLVWRCSGNTYWPVLFLGCFQR